MHRNLFSIGDVDVTVREVLVSIIIVCVLLAVGFSVAIGISNSAEERLEVYLKALPIDTKEKFDYCMKTSVGNSLVYGEIKAMSPVTFSELTGSYYQIERVAERYTRHERTVTYTDSDGNTRTKIETYYEWDYCGSDSKKCDNFILFDNVFPSKLITSDFSQRLSLNEQTVTQDVIGQCNWDYLYKNSTWWYSVGDIRYYFRYVPSNFNATVHANLLNNTMTGFSSNGSLPVYYEQNIESVVDKEKRCVRTGEIVFWVFWAGLIIGAVVGFVYFENRWLED